VSQSGSAASGLGLPPDRLDGFPSASLKGNWHRLSDYENPWFFSTALSSTSIGGGRFDLLSPNGTCYWADSLMGAVGEKLLRVPLRAVTEEQLLTLWHHRVALDGPADIADLMATAVRRFGFNAEIHTSLDYSKPRAWAIALHTAGWRGLRYALRSDGALRNRRLAIFGNAGVAHRAPRGFPGATHSRLDTTAATAVLSRMGVAVLPIPTSVPIRPVRAPRRRATPR
jgi:hypothetical protein